MKKKFLFLCPAKVNLFLHILKKRKDGYHEILSDLARVSLYDELEIRPLKQDYPEIRLIKNYTTTKNTDLIEKTILLLEKKVKKHLPVTIKIKKNIPIGAGLGSGSSNAACVLKNLNNIFQLQLSFSELCEIGAKLGSDIPFFLYQKNLRVTHLGQKIIQPISINNFPLLLLKPSFSCITTNIYQNYQNQHIEKQIKFSPKYNLEQIKKISTQQNSLYQSACQSQPLLKHYYQKMYNTNPLAVQMSGSGSSLFAIYKNPQQRKLAKKKLATNTKEYTLFTVDFI